MAVLRFGVVCPKILACSLMFSLQQFGRGNWKQWKQKMEMENGNGKIL